MNDSQHHRVPDEGSMHVEPDAWVSATTSVSTANGGRVHRRDHLHVQRSALAIDSQTAVVPVSTLPPERLHTIYNGFDTMRPASVPVGGRKHISGSPFKAACKR